MAARNLLAKKKLPVFKKWLEDEINCQIENTKGGYECLRFRINDTLHIVFDNNKTVHLSVQSRTIYLVQRFLDDINKNKIKEVDKETALTPIADALYATDRFPVDDCQEIAEGILRYINDYNMRVVRIK